MKVFVYGTLKSGYGNNTILQRGNAELVQPDRVRGFKLFNCGYPIAVPTDGCIATGEVWDIGDNETTLQNLDWLEGYNGEDRRNHYDRVTVTTEDGHEAFMYTQNSTRSSLPECPSETVNDETIYTWSR